MDVFHHNLKKKVFAEHNQIMNAILFLYFLYITLKDLSCVSTNYIKQTQLFISHTV